MQAMLGDYGGKHVIGNEIVFALRPIVIAARDNDDHIE